MTPDEILQLSTVCCGFLTVWELLRGRFTGAILSGLALFIILAPRVSILFATFLALPVIFEERWHTRGQKDMVRGILAAGVIASSIALFLLTW